MSADTNTGGESDTPVGADPGAVVFEADLLEEGDEVHIARDGYEYAKPLVVEDVDVIEWVDEHGSVTFGTARIELSTGYSNASPHIVHAVSGGRVEWRQGDASHPPLRFDPVDDTEDDVDESGDDAAEEGTDTDGDIEAVGATREVAADDKSGDATDDDLPGGLTVGDVEIAVETNEYLREVADDLGLSEGSARSVVFQLDLYSNVKEGGPYR